MDRRTRARIMALLLVLVLVLSLVGGVLSSTQGSDTSSDTTGPEVTEPPPVTQVSDLPPVALSELPPEALDTLMLIGQGGPFPYPQDGSTFQNREGLLPEQPAGYYREYTVPTPGEEDRGARRLVVGEAFEVFYTDDHYASFREVVNG